MKRRSWIALAQALPAAPVAAPQGPELRDIHLPPDPSWFPPAPGWWILAALLIILLVWLFRVIAKRLRKRRWLAALQGEVDSIESDHAEHGDQRKTTAAVSQLLRRAALRLDPRAAAYQGSDWLTWLDAHGGTTEFVDGPGRVLIDAPWRPSPDVDIHILLALTSGWLAHVFAQEQPHA